LRTHATAFLATVLLAALAGCDGGGGGSGTGAGTGGGTGSGGSDGKGGGTPAAAAPIRIGVAGPITGSEAKNGEDLRNGATLAVEEWNAKGGVLGRTVDLVVRDDEALDKNATPVAQELVNAGVVGVVGHFNSGCTTPASEIYHRAGVVTITPASTNPFVTERGYADVFRVCGRDDSQGKSAADFLAGVLKARKVAVFDDKTSYGKGLADYVAKSLEGRVEVAVREGFSKDERNFRPYLQKVLDAGVDAWYFAGIYHQAAPMLIQASQMGIEAPMMSGDGVHGYKADFIDKVGAAAEGTLTTFPEILGEEFERNYRARFRVDPGPYAIYAYTCANILLKGIADGGAAEGAKIAAAIHAGEFDTPVGRIQFDEKGDVRVNPYKVWVIRGGKHVLHGSK
jgi:branched-chain amino acid transport system substrate-binding protein